MSPDVSSELSAPPRDVVALLVQQHREVERLLQGLVDCEDESQRKRLLHQATDELAVHVGAEETVMYPAVRAGRTEDILLESLEEHLSLKRLVADLLALDPTDTTFTPKCKVLEEQARHHHQEEEEHLFPAVQRLLDAEARSRLGQRVLEHEQALRAEGEPRRLMAAQTLAAPALDD